MSDVLFSEEEPIVPVAHPKMKKRSLFNTLIISTGLAKTDKGANIILIIIAILCIIFSISLATYTVHPPRIGVTQAQIDAANAKLKAGRAE